MKTKIEIEKKVIEEIEVDLPFYYKHEMTDHEYYVIYGKLTLESAVCITEKEYKIDDEIIYEISKEEFPVLSSYYCYFKEDHYHSTKEEFDEALQRAKKFVNGL